MPGTPTPKYAITTMSGAVDLGSSIDDLHNEAMTQIDGLMATQASGTLAGIPAAGKAGRIYQASDTGQVFYDTGTTWLELATTATKIVTAHETGLRTIRGQVQSTGAIVLGAGFTVTVLGTGHYRVTFTTPYSAPPVATASSFFNIGVDAMIAATAVDKIDIRTTTGMNPAAGGFMFIAAGPA